MYLPVEPRRLIEGPVNRGPDYRGCNVYIILAVLPEPSHCQQHHILYSKIVSTMIHCMRYFLV